MSLAMLRETADELIVSVKLPWFVHDTLQDTAERRRFWWTKGLGAGGTYGLAIWHYSMCLINSKSRFSWSIAPTYQQVKDTLIPTFCEVLTEVFQLQEGIDFDLVTSPFPKIVFPKRKQEIHFKSAHKPSTLVGVSVSHISGTEVGLWPEKAYIKACDRLRCPKAERLQVLGEGTPEGFNWWEKLANFDEGIDEKRNFRRLRIPTWHNRFLKAGYVKDLERTYEYDPGKLDSYVEGIFRNFSKGTAYWEFHQSRLVKLDLRPERTLPILLCCDFNKHPLAWVAMQKQPVVKGLNLYHRFVAIAESNGEARGVPDACADFIAAFDPNTFRATPIVLHGDPSGYAGSYLAENCGYDQYVTTLKKYYQNVSVAAAISAPSIKDRLERVNQLMSYEKYVIAAWCRKLISSHSSTSLKDGMWEIKKPSGEDWTHYSDATGYPLFQLTQGEDLENLSPAKTLGFNPKV